ncbi:MAG TPA: hypothetical protein VE991_13915 [Acidimicrobiales bacterium]|nr:hypothetical protein [Acidimicrobiales bacterium]
MANFKRRRPKNRRAGCLLCRPHKANGAPPDSLYSVAELRRLGGRARRVTRHDVAWRLSEERA